MEPEGKGLLQLGFRHHGPGPLLLLLFGNLSVVIFFLRLFESPVCKSIYSLTFSS